MQNKEYSDGILLFQKSNNKVILYDDQRTLLDSLFISNRQICCGMDLESDKYLITIEEEKNDTVATSHQANVNPRQALPRNYSLPSVRRKGFQPPKFTATEKRPHPGPDTTVGPPDKRFKLLIEDDGRQHIPSKPGIVTRDQFFSLYSQQRDQTTSIPRNFASHSVNDSNTIAKGNSRSLYTLKDKENTISECTFNNRSDCQSKRNSSQILALFSSNSNSTFQYSRQGMENYPTELTTDKPTFCGNPSEENKSTLQKTAPSLFNSFGNATKRVDALFESLCREKENNLVHKTGSHSLLTSFGNDDGLSEEKENELKQESIKHMISHLEPAKSAIGLIQEKENGLQEGPAPFFNSYHSNRNGLFNKSKSSYSTTPYLLELSTDNSTSQHDNNTHKPTLNKESYSVFPSQQGPGLDRHQASMWDGSSDMFQVPDIDYDMSDLSDSMGSDFYTHNMAGLDTTSRQSEQEKTDLMTSWKGSLTSDTVRRDSVVPATRLHGTSQFMAGSSASTLTTSEEDKFDLSGWEGNNTRQQGCSGGISQRVPKLKTRRRDPMTSCPTSSHITLYPEVETSSSSLNHHDSANKDFLNQSSPEEITPQFDAQSSFSSQSLSTNRFQVMPVETSSFQSKFSNQNRRVGLRKTGGSSSVGFLPGSKITSQRPSPVTVFNRSSLTDSNIIKETMMGELVFPSSKECDDNVKPCRQVTLPITFTSEQHYRHTMKAALREHLNIILFELAQSFHAGLRKVNISQYGSLDQDTHHDDRPRCSHGVATLRTVKKDGPNKGRLFYCCPGPTNSKCKLFKWANECKTQVASTNREQSQASRPTLSTTQEITSYFRTQNVSLYCECHLIIKKKTKKYGQDKYRYSKRNLADDGAVGPGKTVMYLELSRRETSTAYSKDDIWIVSSSLTFEKHSTFVAKSTYFGPYSSGELEISPISCYSPSKWQSGDVVFALHGYNAANELMCIDNIDDNVKSAYMPLLPRLLTNDDDDDVMMVVMMMMMMS
ncbi:Protein ZGRF1 [Exaiptasia diaphana]|nr:Protein ZGRF1 [Exaiptasia diaphana]